MYFDIFENFIHLIWKPISMKNQIAFYIAKKHTVFQLKIVENDCIRHIK